MGSINEQTVQRILERLVDRIVGDDILPEDKAGLVSDSFEILKT